MNPWSWFRRQRIPVQVALACAAVAGLAAAYWLASPLFVVVRGSEALPENVTVVANGAFVGVDGHHASGTAQLLRDASGGYLVRLGDDFRVTNGPDIHVWLSPTPDPRRGGIDLGAVKFTEGASNYPAPADAANGYRYVVIWCNPFSVSFGHAELSG